MRLFFMMYLFVVFTGCSSKETYIKSSYNLQKGESFTIVNPLNDPIKLSSIFQDELKKYGFKSLIAHPELNGNKKTSQGSGFFINEKGYIATNYHVIQGHKILNIFNENRNFQAKVILEDKKNDIAILIPMKNLFTQYWFKLREEQIHIGERINVIGFPLSSMLGNDIRITQGIISAISGIKKDQSQFQISAPIQPGNSGGPTLDENFQVLGVVTSRFSDTYLLNYLKVVPQNINFSVKANYISTLLKQKSILLPKTSLIKSFEEATKATVLIDSDLPNLINLKEYKTDLKLVYKYTYHWEFDSISYLSLKILTSSNKEIIEGVFTGDSISTPSEITKDLLKKVLISLKEE